MTLKEHYAAGDIKKFFKVGIVCINHMTYFRYNLVFEAYIAKGYNRNKSYEFAADECGCSKDTIMTAVKFVNQEVA